MTQRISTSAGRGAMMLLAFGGIGAAMAQEEILLPPVTVETTAELPPAAQDPAPEVAKATSAPPTKPAKPKVRRRPRVPAAQAAVPAVAPAAPPQPAAPIATMDRATTGGAVIAGPILRRLGLAAADSAQLTQGVTGAAVWGAGGVSGLPAINGMGADRVQVAVSGMMTGAACPNQMNPTLSYIAPEMVGRLTVHSAAAPVSAGGDFSGGRIEAEAADPVFAPAGETRQGGSLSTHWRSNPQSFGLDASATLAGPRFSLGWRGSFVTAGNYRAGDGTTILSSGYRSQNHALDYHWRDGPSDLRLSIGGQYMPEQGFPTQPMDMVLNRSAFANARYRLSTDWGQLEAGAFAHHVRHGMNLLEDKLAWPSFDGTQALMPMDTRATDLGANLTLTLPLNKAETLRLGLEGYRYRIDDWWDPVVPDPSLMMSPYPFINLNDARRDRIGAFAEWERTWQPGLTSVFGLRYDIVQMNTGPVHGYGDPDPALDPQYGGDALIFNAANRARTDKALDGSAALRWVPSPGQSVELAFARKTRAPNLYERYAWSTNIMAMQMTGWFGDGNGHVGDLNLRPEVNHALDLTWRLRDTRSDAWEVSLNPTYAFVRDYIDADRCTGSALDAVYTRCGQPDNAVQTDDFVFLRFANHDAHLAGLNLAGRLRLAQSVGLGRIDLRAQASVLRGWRDDGQSLYNIMPPNAKFTLEHRWGGWTTAMDLQLVGSKHLTSDERNELQTPGYGLVNLQSSYERDNLRFDLGITNLVDRDYALPLGGANVTNGTAVVGQMAAPVWGQPVQGVGRAITLRLTVKF